MTMEEQAAKAQMEAQIRGFITTHGWNTVFRTVLREAPKLKLVEEPVEDTEGD